MSTTLTAAVLRDMEAEAGEDQSRLRAAAEEVIAAMKQGFDTRGEPLLELLLPLAAWLTRLGDHERARRVLARVPLDEVEGIEPRAVLCVYLLERGYRDLAREMTDKTRHDGRYRASTCLLLGSTWEKHGDLALAARWFTLGIGLSPDFEHELVFAERRHRARRSLDLPLDTLDEGYEAAVQHARSAHRAAHPSAVRAPVEGVARRAPCPCGSGKRFKNCHGRGQGTTAPLSYGEVLDSSYVGSDDEYEYFIDIVSDAPASSES